MKIVEFSFYHFDLHFSKDEVLNKHEEDLKLNFLVDINDDDNRKRRVYNCIDGIDEKE
jgi:hypothetical protein